VRREKGEFFKRAVHRCIKGFFFITAKIFFQVSFYGKENIPQQGPLLIASHHASFLDPVIVSLGLKEPICFLARASLFRPPLGWIISILFAYPLRREGGDLAALKSAQELLKNGRVVLLFPEGTRSKDGRVDSFKPGIGLLALRAAVPILPVYLQGTYDSWPRQRKLPRLAKVRVFYGPVLQPEEFQDYPRNREGFDQITRELERRVKNLEKMAEM